MNPQSLLDLLAAVREGKTTPEQAMERLTHLPFEDIDIAKIDHHRTLRTGMPEVIYGAGKTDAQIEQIFERMAAAGGNVLSTRTSPTAAQAILARFPNAVHHAISRIVYLNQQAPPARPGPLAVVCAGTSDLPVAEEAAVTAEVMGHQVVRMYDIGVTGLHRLLSQRDRLMEARAIICCAGMEGALPTVLAGLVRAPVIAVPTSIGYGASFNGLAALLGMLNSCAPNVAVVNIDNGFGAACFATAVLGVKT